MNNSTEKEDWRGSIVVLITFLKDFFIERKTVSYISSRESLNKVFKINGNANFDDEFEQLQITRHDHINNLSIIEALNKVLNGYCINEDSLYAIDSFLSKVNLLSLIDDEENSLLQIIIRDHSPFFKPTLLLLKHQIDNETKFLDFLVFYRNKDIQNVFDSAILNGKQDIFIFLFEYLEVSKSILSVQINKNFILQDEERSSITKTLKMEKTSLKIWHLNDSIKEYAYSGSSEISKHSFCKRPNKEEKTDVQMETFEVPDRNQFFKLRSNEIFINSSSKFKTDDSLLIFKIKKIVLYALGLRLIYESKKVNNCLHWIAKTNNLFLLLFIYDKFTVKNKSIINYTPVIPSSESIKYYRSDYISISKTESEFLSANFSFLKFYIDQSNDYSVSPLQYACFFESKNLWEVMVNMGSDINHSDAEGNTVIVYGVKSANYKLIKKLLIRGASLDTKILGVTSRDRIKQLELKGKIAKLFRKNNLCKNICEVRPEIIIPASVFRYDLLMLGLSLLLGISSIIYTILAGSLALYKLKHYSVSGNLIINNSQFFRLFD